MRAEAEAKLEAAARRSQPPAGASPMNAAMGAQTRAAAKPTVAASPGVRRASAAVTEEGGAARGRHDEEKDEGEEERRLSIELASAQAALPVVEGHREPRGSDAASREQPDMLQALDLLNAGRHGGGIVKATPHYERAAQAAVAGGAPVELSISLVDGKPSKPKKKSKGRAAGPAGAEAARRAQTTPTTHEELR